MKFGYLLSIPFVSAVILPSRIVGGEEVAPAFKYPFLVSLLRLGRPRCGGTLITSSVVLTASHCTLGNDKQYQVLVHRHDFSKSEDEENVKRYDVISRTKHPKFNPNTFMNDIAVWRIIDTGIKTNIIWNRSSDNLNPLLTVMGWGATKSGSNISQKLLQVNLPLYDLENCVADHKDDVIDTKLQVCAGFLEGGRDACQGDSGGPLIGWEGDNPVLVGIVSWGNGCADSHQPGIYTRVSTYTHWINSLLK